MKFRSPLLLLLGIFITGVASADEITTPVVSVVNVQTSDPGAYRAYLIENPEIFEALGAESGGTCTTVSGHRYPGQAFAFSFYNDAGSAFKAATRFANMPRSAELDAISSVVSAEFYAVIKPFTLPPGFERRYQIVVNDAAAYVAAATRVDKQKAVICVACISLCAAPPASAISHALESTFRVKDFFCVQWKAATTCITRKSAAIRAIVVVIPSFLAFHFSACFIFSA